MKLVSSVNTKRMAKAIALGFPYGSILITLTHVEAARCMLGGITIAENGRRKKMIKTERGTTTMNGSLEELIKEYLIILSVFKEKVLAGTFTCMEDVEEIQTVLQEAADISCSIINGRCLDAEVTKGIIKEICEDFRDYQADPLRGGNND